MVDEEHHGAPTDQVHPMDRLPWPNVRGKRCLDLGAPDQCVADELKRRGGAEVVSVAGATALDPDLGVFDVVVGVSVLADSSDPLGALRAVRSVTRGMFLSAEPIDLWMSVLARGAPRLTLIGDGFAFNGAGHKQLLAAAGFAVERVSRPYTVRSPGSREPERAWRDHVNTLGMRAVTGSWAPGDLHRALLARPQL